MGGLVVCIISFSTPAAAAALLGSNLLAVDQLLNFIDISVTEQPG